MSNIIIPKVLSVEEKLALMNDDAKYEVGTDGDAENTALLCASDIKGRPGPPKIPKMFLSCTCIFNCAYCGCRCSREERQAYCNSPAELAEMAVNEAKKNGHGFLSRRPSIKTPITPRSCCRKASDSCGNSTVIRALSTRK